MRLTPLSRACGSTLARDLPPTGPNRIPLLRKGTVITPRFQRALSDHGIHALWVEDGTSEGIEPVELLPEEVRVETAAKVASALDEARTAIGDSQRLGHDVLADLRDVVDLIAASITDSPDAALFLGDLAGADQYTHRHSVNVTALGLLLGRAYWRTAAGSTTAASAAGTGSRNASPSSAWGCCCTTSERWSSRPRSSTSRASSTRRSGR